ncbi:BadF/BadG/BcrA/BcrD ATPase family protein [Actinomadura fulvescens]|uniref:N-acetylglucosamine kinase n=1 Tax=Actinomadura fulvescens TaxID=46160 RepID=A0ABP6C2R5_9ACTN
MSRTLVAVDGGNSKTDVAVVSDGGELLAAVRGPGFRPQAHGVDGAVTMLSGLIADALARAGRGTADQVAAFLAGADFPEEEERLEKALAARGTARHVRVANDTFALLRTGSAMGWGVAIVCGAGINCLGVGPDGRTARFPSLGRITGDWGGGSDLGAEALWHAVRGEDGRGPRTALTAAVAAHFGLARAEDVGLGVHRGDIAWERLTSLAPVLLDTAEAGDRVARGLTDRLGEEIMLLGVTALRRLDLLGSPAEVVLGGGVLTARRPILMDTIERHYAARAPRARLVVADDPPVLGATLLGLDLLGAAPAAHQVVRAAFGPPWRPPVRS